MDYYQPKQKIYLKVRADHLPDGQIIPLMYRAEDGPRMVIDQIIDIREAPSWKVGGRGMRYTCRVGEQFVYLFLEHNGWFLESL